jgi:ubiquitin carboxyl-terminal hydrolase 5/13
LHRAADWLFSHADNLDASVAEVYGQSAANATGGATNAGEADLGDDGEGKYSLMAVISHIGRNTDHGHYVCHIRKNGQWVLFNDEKVGKCRSPPLEYGFMYLYRRNDGPGTFKTN